MDPEPDTERRPHVLLVEDDEDDALLTRKLIEGVREPLYAVEWVTTHARAADALRRGRHDVCLVDYNLRGRSGLDLVREALADGCEVPFVLLTGPDDRDVDAAALDLGVADFLVKGDLTASLLERSLRCSIRHGATLKALRESEARFRLGFERSPLGMALVDGSRRIRHANAALARTMRMSLTDLADAGAMDLVHPDDRETVSTATAELHSGKSEAEIHIEHRSITGDGSTIWVRMHAAPLSLEGDPHGLFVQLEDITERIRTEQRLSDMAVRDELTGLPNRAAISEHLQFALTRAHHQDTGIGILFVDLDHFKRINDSFGHRAGDEVLRRVSRRIREASRASDFVARFAGDEFVVVCEDIRGEQELLAVADRIRHSVRSPIAAGDQEVVVTATVGVLHRGHVDPEGADTLLHQADVAMYEGKSRGRDCATAYDESLRDLAMLWLTTEHAFRRALDRDELTLAYQPMVRGRGEDVEGVEILMRWEPPGQDPIPPSRFIPVAEESGLMVHAAAWTLRRLCTDIPRIAAVCGDLRPTLWMNLSTRQLMWPELAERIIDLCATCDWPRHRFGLEITEQLAMDPHGGAEAALARLREAGVKLAIDDFGTGYSSLASMRSLQPDLLKVDRSLIVGLGVDPGAEPLCRAAIDMAHALGIEVVCEGVETDLELDVVKRIGTDLVQGYAVARPAPLETFLRLMAGGPDAR